MDIGQVLDRFLVDIYEAYCDKKQLMTQEEFDCTFFDEEGNDISDHDYIIAHYDDIFQDEVFEELYRVLIDDNIEKDVTKERLVNFLAGHFFIYYYHDETNSTIDLLKNTEFSNIINMFMEVELFGLAMVKAYYYSLIDIDRCTENMERIKDADEECYVDRYFNNAKIIDILMISELLRNVIVDLYSFYISNGYGDDEALESIWLYFTRDFDPVGALDRRGTSVQEKEIYKNLMLRIIYSDIYEDVMNNNSFGNVTEEDRKYILEPITKATNGDVIIPGDIVVRNRLLKHFLVLQDEKRVRQRNRTKTYKDKREHILKKINPIYRVDDMTFYK